MNAVVSLCVVGAGVGDRMCLVLCVATQMMLAEAERARAEQEEERRAREEEEHRAREEEEYRGGTSSFSVLNQSRRSVGRGASAAAGAVALKH